MEKSMKKQTEINFKSEMVQVFGSVAVITDLLFFKSQSTTL